MVFEGALELVSKQYHTGIDLRVKQVRELRQRPVEGVEQTLELTYDLGDATYKTATNLAFFPENSESDVAWVAKEVLDMSLDTRFIFRPNPVSKRSTAPKHPFPTPTTVQDALRKYVDLRGPLRKKLITDLADYCLDPNEKKE